MKREYRSKPEGEWKLASEQDYMKTHNLHLYKFRRDRKRSQEFIKREVPEREPTNRERVIALMANRAYFISEWEDVIYHPQKDPNNPVSNYHALLKRDRGVYNQLRNLLLDTQFQSDDVDETLVLLYQKSTGSKLSRDEKDAAELAFVMMKNSYRDWHPKVNTTSHHSLYFKSNEIPNKDLRNAIGYKKATTGDNEIIGLIPIDPTKKKPLYLGTQIKYRMRDGGASLAHIVGFTLPISPRKKNEMLYVSDFDTEKTSGKIIAHAIAIEDVLDVYKD